MDNIKWVSQVEYDDTVCLISEYCVMQSNAGFYIGRWSKETKGECVGLVEPWDRQTGYYRTRALAEKELVDGCWVTDFNTSVESASMYEYKPITTPIAIDNKDGSGSLKGKLVGMGF
jgi:hypothetical protein